MPTGTVKWFNNAKGFGFILPDEGNEDVFAHYSMIEMDGYRTLKAGQTVEFDISQGDKGLHAINIRHAASTVDANDANVSPENNALTQPDPDNKAASETAIPEEEGA